MSFQKETVEALLSKTESDLSFLAKDVAASWNALQQLSNPWNTFITQRRHFR